MSFLEISLLACAGLTNRIHYNPAVIPRVLPAGSLRLTASPGELGGIQDFTLFSHPRALHSQIKTSRNLVNTFKSLTFSGNWRGNYIYISESRNSYFLSQNLLYIYNIDRRGRVRLNWELPSPRTIVINILNFQKFKQLSSSQNRIVPLISWLHIAQSCKLLHLCLYR